MQMSRSRFLTGLSLFAAPRGWIRADLVFRL